MGVVAFMLGKWFGSRHSKTAPKTKEEMKEMRKLARETEDERIEDRKDAILLYALQKGRITNDEAEAMFCISDSTARHYLNELEEEGKLKQIGKTGRGVYYVPRKG